ncbi:hypothetical protein Ct61P_00166 [Colletotrichum tofieldiae]|nr:hypothetical protein Ct61P_00166 [Colletotrichum tofieldiae]
MPVRSTCKSQRPAVHVSSRASSHGSSGKVGDRARAVHDTTAIGSDVDDIGLVSRTNKRSAIECTKALATLKVNPGSTEISAAIKLLALSTLAENV